MRQRTRQTEGERMRRRMVREQSEQHPEGFTCPECGHVTVTESTMRGHRRVRHGVESE